MLHKTKSVLIKLLLVLCAMCCACALAFGLVGCSDESESGKSISEVKIEDGCLVIYYTDETSVNLGTVVGSNGTNGADGADGVGIESVDIVDGDLIITYTTGDTHNAGAISTISTSTDAVASITKNEDGDIVVTYINGNTETIDLDGCECPMDDHSNSYTITISEVSCAKEVDGVELSICQDCGYAHVNVTEWAHDFSKTDVVPVSCTVDGYTTTVCTKCGAESGEKYDIVEATGHLVNGITITQEDIDTIGFAEILKDSAPTYYVGKDGGNVCVDGGLGVYVCTKCGDGVYAIEVEALGHLIEDWEITKLPEWLDTEDDDDETGILAGYCSRCGSQQATITLPELQFVEKDGTEYYELYVDSSIYPNITYTIEGQEAYCTDDAREITITITYYGQTKTFTTTLPEHGHVLSDLMIFEGEYFNEAAEVYNSDEVYNLADYEGMSIVVNVNGTITGFGDNEDTAYVCHEDGVLGAFICYVCGDTIYIKVRVAHTYDEVVESFEGSCTEVAYTIRKCTVCGEEVTEYGTTTDHVYSSTSFTDATYSATTGSITITVTCDVCGASKSVVYEAGEYTYEVITEATCEEAGVWEITFVYPKDDENGVEYNITVETVKVAHAYHGWDIDQTEIYTSDEVEDLYEQYKGKSACCDYVEGYFTCDYCGKFISVVVVDRHAFKAENEVSVVSGEVDEEDTTKINADAFDAILANYEVVESVDSDKCSGLVFVGTEEDEQLDINTIYVIVTDAVTNCVNGTTSYKYCSDCGHWVVVTSDAEGHDYDWEVTTEPTEISKGVLTGTCSNCGNVVTVEIPDLTDLGWTVTTEDADCQNEGLKTYERDIDVSAESGVEGDTVHVTVKVVLPVTDSHTELTTITFKTTVGDITYLYVAKICSNGNHMYDATLVGTLTGSADSNN